MEQYTEKNTFTLWQYPLLVAHLEEMAQKGWMLNEAEGNQLVYDQCAPQKVHFAVTFFPAYDFLDPVPPPSLERLWQFCENSGWQHVTDNASMQIFYNTAENPVPLHTDAAVQLGNFDAMMKIEKVKLWKQNVIIGGIVLLFIATVIAFVSMDRALKLFVSRVSPVMLLLLAKHIYTFITDGAKWLNYHLWYKKAKQTAFEKNIFWPPKENITLKKTDKAVLTVIAAAMWFFVFKSGELTAMLVWCGIIFGIIAFYIVVMRFMKKQGVSAENNRFVSGAIIALVIVLLIAALPHIIMFFAESGLGESFVTIHREYPTI